MLILGAGPVGLELAGEITEVWPDRQVVIVDRGGELLPGFLPEVRDDLRRQLDELGIDVRLGTGLAALPPIGAGRAGRFTVTTDRGDEIVADIRFRGRLNVRGYDHVYAVGDIAALPDPKMASYAMTQAEVVVTNIRAQLAGDSAGSRPPPDRATDPASARHARRGRSAADAGRACRGPAGDGLPAQGRRPVHGPVRRPLRSSVAG